MKVSELIEWLQQQPQDYVFGIAYDGFINEATWEDVGRTDTAIVSQDEDYEYYPYKDNWNVLRADGQEDWMGDKTTNFQSSVFVSPLRVEEIEQTTTMAYIKPCQQQIGDGVMYVNVLPSQEDKNV